MSGLLSYLPQYDFEVGSVALAVCFTGLGLILLLTGTAPGEHRLNTRTVRLIGGFQILLGVGVGALGLSTNAEPPGGLQSGHWGGTTNIVMLGVWLAGLTAIFVSILRRYKR
jgi:hypothetical protein